MTCPQCERSGAPVVYAKRAPPQVPDANESLRGLCKSGFRQNADFNVGQDVGIIHVDMFSMDTVKAAARVTELKASGWDDSSMGSAWAQWWGMGRVSPKNECIRAGVYKPWHAVEGWLVVKRPSAGTPKPMYGPIVKKAPSGSIMTLDRGIPSIMSTPGIPAGMGVYAYRAVEETFGGH